MVLRGATFHVLFTDASQLPPPFRIDNLSEVCLVVTDLWLIREDDLPSECIFSLLFFIHFLSC